MSDHFVVEGFGVSGEECHIGLKCWQRVYLVVSSIWFSLLLVLMIFSSIYGQIPSVAGIIVMAIIAFVPPALLYFVAFSVDFLVRRIRGNHNGWKNRL